MKVGAIIVAIILVVSTITLMPTIPAFSVLGTPKNVSNNASDSTLSFQEGNQIAIGNNIHIVWEEVDEEEIYYSTSDDNGSTFSTPINLSNDLENSYDPQIVAVGFNVHVIWMSEQLEETAVYYTRSTDNGANFDTPVVLSEAGSANDPRIAASGSDVFVVWTDTPVDNFEILVRRSTDNGASFETARNVSNDADASLLPSIALGNDVHIAWTDIGDTGNFIFYSRSTDNGASYGSSVDLGSNLGTIEGPELAANGDNVYLAWIDNLPGDLDVFHRYSSDSGSSFSSAVNISDSSGDSSDLTILVSGTDAFIAWSDTTWTADGDIMMSHSNDGFISSELMLSITDDSSVLPRIAVVGTTAYVFWQECGDNFICDIHYMTGEVINGGLISGDSYDLTNDLADSFHPHAAASSDTAFVIWTSAASPGEIMFARDPAQEPPVANAGEDQDTLEGLNVSLNGTASYDIDDDTLSFSWEQTAGTSVTLSNADTSTPSFTAPEVSSTEVLTFELTVSAVDGSSQDTVNVSVNDMTGILNLSDDSADSFLPSVAASGNYVYAAWEDNSESDTEIMFSRSADGGTTFSPPVNITNDGTNSVVPILAAINNQVYLIWEDHTTAVNHEILLKKSTDNGATFGSAVNVSNDAALSTVPHMFVTNTNVHATWESGSPADVMFSTSTDGGTTFGTPENLSANLGNSVLPIVAASQSNVLVTWSDDTPGNYDIMYAVSTNSGVSFDTAENLSNNSGYSDWPWVSSSGSNMYLAWSDDTSGNDEIMFSTSTNNGVTFGTPVNLSSNSGSSLVPFVSSTSNKVIVAWSDTSSPSEILYAVSTNNGATFAAATNVSNNSGHSEVPQVAQAGDSISIIWEDYSSNNIPEIFFTRLVFADRTLSDTLTLSDSTTASRANAAPISETLTLTDSILASTSYGIDDELAVSDAINPQSSLERSISDDITITESINTTSSNTPSLSDDITLADTLTASLSTGRSLSDDITTTESVSTFASSTRAISDNITTTDVISTVSTAFNDPPTANAGADQAVDEGDFVTLNGIGSSDPENNTLTFSWTQTDGPPVVLSNANIASPTFTAPSITSDVILTFQLIVNDGTSNSSPDTVTITVNDRKGLLTIKKVNQNTDELLAGAEFTITPNPFTLEQETLLIQDNSDIDADATNGIITLSNVEFETYTIEETVVPAGFVRVVQNVIVSVHSTQQEPIVIIENRPDEEPIEETVEVPAPDLSSTEFNNFVLQGALVEGEPVTTVDDLPPALLTPTEVTTLPKNISFTAEAPSDSTVEDLISKFTIPKYVTPTPGLATGNVFVVPAILIGHDDSENNFLLPPVLTGTISGMTLLFGNEQPVSTESGDGQVKEIAMKFSDAGAANNVAFSVSITDTVPKNTPEPSSTQVETAAMFVEVTFSGDFTGSTTFSEEEAFEESPKISVLVKKSLDIKKLEDGCPDVSLFFFDEEEERWVLQSEPDRDPSLDNTEYCGYVLETGHWSKFAVGGVKIATNALRSIGGSSAPATPSANSKIPTGADASTSVSLPGSGTVKLTFDNVLTGGDVKVSKPALSKVSNLFSEVKGSTASLSIKNNNKSVPYSTAGNLLDIDASKVQFKGPVQVTIPYDPLLMPENVLESEVRFLHYTGTEWEDATLAINMAENTVTGNLTSLSPVVPGVIDDNTFDASYFVGNPLKKVSILAVKSTMTQSSDPADKVQVELSTTLKNMQKMNQDYAMIIQVLDENGYTESISWSTGNLDRGTETAISVSTTLGKGQYDVMVFVWDKVSKPVPLSTITYHDLNI